MHFSLKAFSTDQMKFGAVISTRCNDLIIRRLCKANNKKSPVFFLNYSFLGKRRNYIAKPCSKYIHHDMLLCCN